MYVINMVTIVHFSRIDMDSHLKGGTLFSKYGDKKQPLGIK